MSGEKMEAGKPIEGVRGIAISDQEITVETTDGQRHRFVPEAKMQETIEAAKKLLEKYREERRKQFAAMRLAARCAVDRQDIQRKKYWDDREIETFAKIFGDS